MAAIQYRQVTKRFGGDVVAVDNLTLDVEEGEFLILVGPSGCGKTTALRMTAGLEEITSGEIRIGGDIVNDRPPTDRDIAMVFQNYALYPHMTVYENIAFPLRQRRVKRREIKARVDEAARLLAIEQLLDRRPRELSGGQRQRVAIGRALVRRPQAFLMDEPLSNLDAKLRVQMRAELLSLHKRLGITTVYVTHDQTEAMTLGDRVVVLDHGIVQQVDTPERLYRYPRNVFVAGFIGSPSMNFLHGVLDGSSLALGSRRVELDGDIVARLTRTHGDVIVGLRPEDLHPANGSAAAFQARVVIVEQLGPEIVAYLHTDEVRALPAGPRPQAESEAPHELRDAVVARLPGDTRVASGDLMQMAPRLRRVSLFDARTGESLLT